MTKVTSAAVTRFAGGVPFEFDLLEQDLDAKYGNFALGNPITWGIAVAAVDGAWKKSTTLRGIDWRMTLYPPGEFEMAVPRKKEGSRVRWKAVNRTCALITVKTDKTTMNAAREVGRRSVTALVGLLRREIPLILPADVIWEGALVRVKENLRMSTAGLEMELQESADPKRIHRLNLKLAPVSIDQLPPSLKQGLQWLASARAARLRVEKFMHLWLAIIAIVSYGKKSTSSDMSRVRQYTATMAHGIGGVRSPMSINILNLELATAYRIRNDVVHRNDQSRLTVDLLNHLEQMAFQLVDFEFAKLGIAMPPGP